MPSYRRPSSLRRTLAVLACAAALLVPTAACSGGDGGDPGRTLNVGFVVDPSWAQVPVAQQAGYFEQRGLKVNVINFSTGVEALQALQGGQVDITTAADVPSSSALAKSNNLRVVGDGSRWTGSTIVARRSSGVTSIEQLAGKKIGTPLGTSASYFATSVLDTGRINAELVQVAPSAMVSAMSQGNVDAVSIFQPYQAQVLDVLGGDAVALKAPADVYRQHSLYLAQANTAQQKAGAFKDFFAALDQAGAELAKGDQKAIDAVVKATNLNPALVRKVLAEFDFTLQLKPDLADKLATLSTWARTRKFLDPQTPVANYRDLLDPSALPKP